MIYIQRRGHGLETVDEFETWAEARAMLAEYRLADPTGSITSAAGLAGGGNELLQPHA